MTNKLALVKETQKHTHKKKKLSLNRISVQHRTVLIIFPLVLQIIIITQINIYWRTVGSTSEFTSSTESVIQQAVLDCC